MPTDLATVIRSRTGRDVDARREEQISVAPAKAEITHIGSGHGVSELQPGAPSSRFEYV